MTQRPDEHRGDDIMINAVAVAFGVLLMSVGVVELVRLALLMLFRDCDDSDMIVIVRGRTPDDCEYRLRRAAGKIRWMDSKKPCRLILINENGNPEIDAICEKLEQEYPFLSVCKPEELEYNING